MASDTEAELGGLFENYQKETSKRTALAEMGHQQPPTTENTAQKETSMERKKISRAIDMIFYWVRDRIRQNHFHIFW